MRRIESAFMLLLLASAMALPPGKAAYAGVLVDITGDSVATCGACGVKGSTMGWAFTVSHPITIDGLGFFDVGANGLGVAPVQVGLWTIGGSLLAQAAVSSGSTAEPSTDANGDWLVESIALMTLPAGDYLIGASFGSSLPLAEAGDGDIFGNLIGVSADPRITVTGGQIGDFNGGFEAPTAAFVFPVFGPTLSVSVPEPRSLALLGVAFAGLAATRRKSQRSHG
jgi:hypothetical protein